MVELILLPVLAFVGIVGGWVCVAGAGNMPIPSKGLVMFGLFMIGGGALALIGFLIALSTAVLS